MSDFEFKPTVSKPAPFERPAIDLSGGPVSRQWLTIPARDVHLGDTIANLGRVKKVQVFGDEVVIEAGDWPAQVYVGDDPLLTFTNQEKQPMTIPAAPPITSFTGKYGFLSNFYASPIEQGGETYPTAEHFFQAMKTEDLEWRDRIRKAANPSEAKKLGRKVPLRPDWNQYRLHYMSLAITRKFAPGSVLLESLLATGDALLVEGNTWGDEYWGVCAGRGENHLGKLLMEWRNHRAEVEADSKAEAG